MILVVCHSCVVAAFFYHASIILYKMIFSYRIRNRTAINCLKVSSKFDFGFCSLKAVDVFKIVRYPFRDFHKCTVILYEFV